MSILIVEDDKTSARVIEIILKKYGFVYHTVENGSLALDYMLVNPDIRLVISDIMMPVMDGLQLLTELKKAREFANTPVIMCTTKADVDTVKRAVRSGCDDYVIKPINPLQMLRKVEQILEQQTPVLLEYRNLVSSSGMDRHTYQEMLKEFTVELEDKLELVQEHIDEAQPFEEGELEGFADICEQVGAMRLHELVVNSTPLLCDTGVDISKIMAELRLFRRELLILDYTMK